MRRRGGHVSGVLLVAGGICDVIPARRSVKETMSDINCDSLLTFAFKPIQEISDCGGIYLSGVDANELVLINGPGIQQ
jgi:hypothetical protein